MNLRAFEDSDVELMRKWLEESHISKWFEHPGSWIKEIELRAAEYSFIHHFIMEQDSHPFGFCQYYKYAEGGEEWQGTVPIDGTYSIDYLIGDTDFLSRGYGAETVKLLTERIAVDTDARRVIVQPEPYNLRSRNTLLSAGYVYDSRNDLYRYDIDR